MKPKIKIFKIIVVITMIIMTSNFSFGQFNSMWDPTNTYRMGRFAPALNIRSIGIGNFTSINRPQATLHLNANLTTACPDFTLGELFRTSGPAFNTNAWRLFTGTGNGTEKFSLFTLPNSSIVNIQATDATGEFVFNTLNREKLRISNDNDDQIFAFGNYAPYGANLFVPTSPAKFNINDRNNSISNTENAILLRVWGRGFNRGVDPNGINTNYTLAEFIQSADNAGDAGILIQGSRASGSNADLSFIDFGNNDINNGGDHVLARVAVGIETPQLAHPTLERGVYRIYTNAGVANPLNTNTGTGLIERFRITSDGEVGIGNFNNSSAQGIGTPNYIDARMDIDGDLRIREVTQDDNLTQVLVIDPNDLNRVHFRDISSFPSGGGIGAQICNTMPINNVSKWTGTELCQTQIWDDASRVGIDISNPTAKLSIFNGGAQTYSFDIRNSTNQFTVQQFDNGATGFNAYSPINALGYGFLTDYVNSNAMGFANGMAVTTRTTGGIAPSNIHGFQSTVSGDVSQNHIGIISQPLNNNGGNIAFQSLMQNNALGNVGLRINITALNASSNNYGTFITIPSGNGMSNYGVYSSVPAITNNWAGFFQGNLNVNGTYYQNGGVFTSDQQFKTNINNIEDANLIIDQLQPKEFYFDTTNSVGMNFSNKKQFGLIAQEVENILPELVGNNSIAATFDTLGNMITPAFTYKTLNYNAFIGILLQAQKEDQVKINSQDSIINSLQDQINTLYGMITACCNSNSNMPQNYSMQQNQNGNSLDVTLTDNIPSIVLDQNVPNPFAEQTTITYTLTDGVQKAQMLFYNIEGKLIQSAELLNTAGQGQINVFANDLSTGVYTYSLVVDGQIKGTKRMVKQ